MRLKILLDISPIVEAGISYKLTQLLEQLPLSNLVLNF